VTHISDPSALREFVSTLETRNIVTSRGRTSMKMEPEIWNCLALIAAREGRSENAVIRAVEAEERGGSLTSAVRVYVVRYLAKFAFPMGMI